MGNADKPYTLLPYLDTKLFNSGISAMQGGHFSNQKLMTTTWFFKSESENGFLLTVKPLNEDKSLPVKSSKKVSCVAHLTGTSCASAVKEIAESKIIR